ncbi:MAG: PA2169 family four-helix-bundle protein [Acidobacteria bacterium]|nr:PA2169 family four-helix-bundle protein [Acidobacteriota bacterium]
MNSAEARDTASTDEEIVMNDKPIEVLNDLISTCRDGEEGFGKAAKSAHGDDLRRQLTDFARLHRDFLEELRQEVRRLGGEPAERGHGGGILHPGWGRSREPHPPERRRQHHSRVAAGRGSHAQALPPGSRPGSAGSCPRSRGQAVHRHPAGASAIARNQGSGDASLV